MGYNTRFTGEIMIDPQLTWAQIKDSPFLPENARTRGGKGRDLMFNVVTAERDTDDGILTVHVAVGLVSTWEDEARGYDIEAHLQEVVDTFRGHRFLGRIDAEGEQPADIWRLKVVNGRAVRVDPVITWPTESE